MFLFYSRSFSWLLLDKYEEGPFHLVLLHTADCRNSSTVAAT